MVKQKKDISIRSFDPSCRDKVIREGSVSPGTDHSSGRRRILVVDDDPIIISLLKSRLEEENFDVITAMSGEKGLEVAKTGHPDLVILDVMLPGIGGYEVCIQLKGDPKTCQIPILMLSCRCGDLDQQIGFDCGADEYIGKPYQSEDLLKKIHNLLKIDEHGVQLKEKIVVVVNDKNDFKTIKKILSKVGLSDVEFAQYECDAMDMIQKTRPEVVIMDLQLIDSNAFDLSHKLNNINNFSAKCIVIFADDQSEEDLTYTSMCFFDRIIQRSRLEDKLLSCLQDLL